MAAECVVDASVILNLGLVRGLHVLTDCALHDWKITPLIRAEIREPESRMVIERAILDGRIQVVELDTTSDSENALWATWSEELDAGEAEAVAIAIAHGWTIALEDRKAQRKFSEAVGAKRWINCADLLLDAVAKKRMSLADADDLFQHLSCYSGYARRGITSLSALI